MNSKRWGWAIVIVLGALSVGCCATTTTKIVGENERRRTDRACEKG